MTLHYEEGTLFAVPLRCGGYALGLIARMTRKGRVLLCYFFAQKHSTIPDLAEIPDLQERDAAKVMMIGDLSLYKREWPVIGKLPSWDRSKWPVPVFVRRSELSEKAWLVYYSDKDPNRIEKEVPTPYPSSEYPPDSMHGAGAAEIILTRLLCPPV
jgi:hypothetical protein